MKINLKIEKIRKKSRMFVVIPESEMTIIFNLILKSLISEFSSRRREGHRVLSLMVENRSKIEYSPQYFLDFSSALL